MTDPDPLLPLTYIPRSEPPTITEAPPSTPPTTTRYFIDDRIPLRDGPTAYVVYEQDAEDYLVGRPLYVAVDAILEFVSPAHLEEFENWRFENPKREPPLLKVDEDDIFKKQRPGPKKRKRIVATAPGARASSSHKFVAPGHKTKRAGIVVPVTNDAGGTQKRKRGRPPVHGKKGVAKSIGGKPKSRLRTPQPPDESSAEISSDQRASAPGSARRRSTMVEVAPVDGPEEYEVESILRHQDVGGLMFYFVKWVGYSPVEGSWLSEHELEGAADLLEEYRRLAFPDI